MTKKILLISLIYIFMLAVGNVYALEDGVTIPLVADRVVTDGEQGMYLNAQVIVTNGTGHVFVDTNPFTQVDLQGSARIAATVASDVLGINEKSYDFYYIIEINSPIIGGPSAGGALTVATIAAINHWTIRPGVAMTGMIDPDETIGPVGGIPYKLQAAAAKGTTVFLVPQGQLVMNVTKLNVTVSNSSVVHNTREETVDLAKLGNKLNVTVKEIGTIQDAVLAFTGHDISKPFNNGSVFTSNYLNLLQPLAAQLQNESKKMYNDTYSTSGNSSMMQNAKESQSRADRLVNDKKYYAATSLYFLSMINILTVQWTSDYNRAIDKKGYIANITDKVKNQIMLSENDLNKFKSNGTGDVEVIGAAESRIMEASDIMENLNSSGPETIPLLVFAYERAKTAQWWLSLAVPSGKTISEDTLKERSGWYMSQAQSMSTYTQALLADSGVTIADLGDTTKIQKEIDRGFYSGAIFDSLKIISRLSTGIELAGLQDPSIRVNQSEYYARSVINDVRSRGIEPTLAVSIYEYGGISNSPYEKKSEYSYARMVAKVTESLYSQEKSADKIMLENGIIVQNITSNARSNATSHKSPAFEAIGLIGIIISIFCFIRLRRNY